MAGGRWGRAPLSATAEAVSGAPGKALRDVRGAAAALDELP